MKKVVSVFGFSRLKYHFLYPKVPIFKCPKWDFEQPISKTAKTRCAGGNLFFIKFELKTKLNQILIQLKSFIGQQGVAAWGSGGGSQLRNESNHLWLTSNTCLVHFTMYNVHTLYNVHCPLYNVQAMVHGIPCTRQTISKHNKYKNKTQLS